MSGRMLAASGGTTTTRSGRVIQTPVLTGRIERRLAAVDAWLVSECIREADHLRDEHALTLFRGMTPTGAGKYAQLSDGDRDAANTYLFDEQFALPPASNPVWSSAVSSPEVEPTKCSRNPVPGDPCVVSEHETARSSDGRPRCIWCGEIVAAPAEPKEGR